jgi:hypothetical protein
MPQAPRTWIRTGDRRQPRIIGVPRTRPYLTTPRPRPPRRSGERLPETSVSLPGMRLSDEGGQGERARSRSARRVWLGRFVLAPPWILVVN